MRLRGCVAIELFVGALVATAVSGAAIWGVAELRGVLGAGQSTATAHADEDSPGLDRAQPDAPEPSTVQVSAPASGAEQVLATAAIGGEPVPEPAEVAGPTWSGQFLGQSDEELLAPLRDSPVQAVKLNRGGSSLSLRLDLESGGRAACKPNQIHLHSQPRRELAAYRVNRLLGLSSVPPSVGRRFQVAELAERFKAGAARDRTRFMAEVVPEREGGSSILSELTYWVPVLEPAMIEGFDIDTVDGVVT
ncbi:MAG TPA: hypothetical protein VNO33_16370, partial [Kofleriaceae bacterium]|nr:hypothetical protein [Kofleriaceae bacterium]